jgi:GT2 family glycosyltransferase/glycosyltransferase involved in cell wall biosynthesis
MRDQGDHPRAAWRPWQGLGIWLGYEFRSRLAMLRRGLASLRSRGWRGTWQRVRERLIDARSRPPPPAPIALVAVDEIVFSATASPTASIVIPAFNQVEFTERCLAALSQSGDRADFEVIVVDDASSDDTPARLARIRGLRYSRNGENLGFVGSCNAGAAQARGEFVVFLNNDTMVQPGWLDALLDTFRRHPDTGLAGSKLIYPDGRLQEAGGIVFADGSGWNYGRFDDPGHPRYGFVREVDYCSGAAIALPRALFETLGGFDRLYSPAYYEDVDLAMRVRQHGLKVRYQPASVVVHFEGTTAGTDTTQGVKAYQVVNQEKFVARWRTVLEKNHAPKSMPADHAIGHWSQRRVLWLDAVTPTPDRDAGSLRQIEIMALLQAEGCQVCFLPQNLAYDPVYSRALQQAGVEVWWQPWVGGLPRWLSRQAAQFDLVIVSRHYTLAPLLPLLRSRLPNSRILFDTVDLHYLRRLREAELSGDAAQLRAAQQVQREELHLIAHCDVTWVVSTAEHEQLRALLPDARVDILPTIHQTEEYVADFESRRDLMFVGSYRHPPNVDAALWLAGEIFPRIRAARPEVRLHLVGDYAPTEVSSLAQRDGIVVHGHVPDLDALIDRTRINLAPLRFGAGVKGKISHSLARGLPVVATSCAVEGMHLQGGEEVLVSDDAGGFADIVLRLYDDQALWQILSQRGQEHIRRHFSRDVARAAVRELLDSLPARQ